MDISEAATSSYNIRTYMVNSACTVWPNVFGAGEGGGREARREIRPFQLAGKVTAMEPAGRVRCDLAAMSRLADHAGTGHFE
jgi:hypothetical protein